MTVATEAAAGAPAVEIDRPAGVTRRARVEILDLIAVERVVTGRYDLVRTLTPCERREAIRQGFERGWTAREVASRLRAGSAQIRTALEEPITLLPA